MASGMIRAINIAEMLDDEQLDEIGTSLKTQVERDISSRSEWLEKVEEWVELTTQVMDEKSWPWQDASNVKYPLVSTACIQFHARAFPALLGSTSPVRGKVIGKDPDGAKADRAARVQMYMNYNVLYKQKEWLDDMDRLLILLPMIGAVYKKVFYNPRTGQPESILIHPRDFIINYDARDFKNARKTHRIWKTPNQIKSLQLQGIYREFEGDDVFQPPKQASEAKDNLHGLNNPGVEDPEALQEMYETHCLLDLDEDGYKEPYIVTLRETDGKVYRITAAYSEEDRMMDGNTVVEIEPTPYFTPYFFLPDPESKTHGIGFGTMVGPMNHAVNTLVNQLVDAGTLSNLQGGFLSRGIRVKGGNVRFTPGEWKTVNATGDDLRKGIFPMPTREPSNVLFQLLGLLIDAGQDLSSVQDIMKGRNPGQNQPFRTSEMVMQQGLQVFNGIYKRIYRAMTKEFRLIYDCMSDHFDLREYLEVLDIGGMEAKQSVQEVGLRQIVNMVKNDFSQQGMDIIPTAEPDMIVELERAQKAESLMAKLEAGLPINPQVALRRMLEAEQHDGIEELLDVPPPQPNPEIMIKDREATVKEALAEAEVLYKEAQASNLDAQTQIMFLEQQGKSTEQLHSQFLKEKEQNRKQFEAVTQRLKALRERNGQNRETGGESK